MMNVWGRLLTLKKEKRKSGRRTVCVKLGSTQKPPKQDHRPSGNQFNHHYRGNQKYIKKKEDKEIFIVFYLSARESVAREREKRGTDIIIKMGLFNLVQTLQAKGNKVQP